VVLHALEGIKQFSGARGQDEVLKITASLMTSCVNTYGVDAVKDRLQQRAAYAGTKISGQTLADICEPHATIPAFPRSTGQSGVVMVCCCRTLFFAVCNNIMQTYNSD
jgi:hypothetical protein